MKILLYGTSANELRQDARRICAWRAPNIYLGRGLRLSRQRLCRKAGKVSLYR
jgi:ribosomal protein L6P/L9E